MKKLVSFILIAFVSAFAMAQETITFQAEITNKNGDIIYIKDNQNTIQEIKGDSKGIFKATFSVKEGIYQLFDGVEYAQLYLKNGFDLKMALDASNFDESLKFKGKGEKENNFLAQETLLDQKYGYEDLLASDEESFKKQIEDKKKADFERLEKAGLTPFFIDVYKKGLEMGLVGLQEYYTKIAGNRKLNNTNAPNFDFENHKDGKTSLESMKGKYVYIDVWATWCGPCRAEIPYLKKAEEKYHGKNIEFVSISVDTDKDHDKWKTFVTEKALGGIQLFADKNWNSDFIKAFGINSIPRFILIDPNGVVVDADAKRPSNPKLIEQLDGLLK